MRARRGSERNSTPNSRDGEKAYLEKEHDMVRRVDPDGESLVSRHRSGYAWCRLGLKLMNRDRPQEKEREGQGKC